MRIEVIILWYSCREWPIVSKLAKCPFSPKHTVIQRLTLQFKSRQINGNSAADDANRAAMNTKLQECNEKHLQVKH